MCVNGVSAGHQLALTLPFWQGSVPQPLACVHPLVFRPWHGLSFWCADWNKITCWHSLFPWLNLGLKSALSSQKKTKKALQKAEVQLCTSFTSPFSVLFVFRGPSLVRTFFMLHQPPVAIGIYNTQSARMILGDVDNPSHFFCDLLSFRSCDLYSMHTSYSSAFLWYFLVFKSKNKSNISVPTSPSISSACLFNWPAVLCDLQWQLVSSASIPICSLFPALPYDCSCQASFHEKIPFLLLLYFLVCIYIS